MKLEGKEFKNRNFERGEERTNKNFKLLVSNVNMVVTFI